MLSLFSCNNRFVLRKLIDNYYHIMRLNYPELFTKPIRIEEVLRRTQNYPETKEFVILIKQYINNKYRNENCNLSFCINCDYNDKIIYDLIRFNPVRFKEEKELEEQLYYYMSYNYIIKRQENVDNFYIDLVIKDYDVAIELKVISNSNDIYRYVGQVKNYKKYYDKVYGYLFFRNPSIVKNINIIENPTIISLDKNTSIKVLYSILLGKQNEVSNYIV